MALPTAVKADPAVGLRLRTPLKPVHNIERTWCASTQVPGDEFTLHVIET
jgi:hypothetical protein